MAHLGVISYPSTGPLHMVLPLARQLERRGHRVTLLTMPDAEAKVRAAGVELRAIGAREFPLGSMDAIHERLGRMKGIEALRYTLKQLEDQARVVLDEGPAACRELGVDALVVNQSSMSGGTVAEHLRIPFVTVCSALLFNRDRGVPPIFTTWRYRPSRWAQLRNELSHHAARWLGGSILRVINDRRRRWELPLARWSDDLYSGLAQISQSPAAFEFPRHELPPWFHFCGPFHTPTVCKSVPFPWERLDPDKPLIYASMGTLQNRLAWVFERIAAACVGLDVQLVLSMGRAGSSLASLPALEGDPLVVDFAPQLELLDRAALAIVHGGMNTTMECLQKGIPMITVPVANDQPGVAARVAWSGVGEMLTLRSLSVARLRGAIERVLGEPSYRANARRLQDECRSSGGVERAASIIEEAITSGRPVLSS